MLCDPIQPNPSADWSNPTHYKRKILDSTRPNPVQLTILSSQFSSDVLLYTELIPLLLVNQASTYSCSLLIILHSAMHIDENCQRVLCTRSDRWPPRSVPTPSEECRRSTWPEMPTEGFAWARCDKRAGLGCCRVTCECRPLRPQPSTA